MSRIQTFLKELDHEVETTRKMLSRVPNDKYDWKPHEKSMDIRRLSTHIADLPGWVNMALTSDELDFANTDWKEEKIDNTTDLVDYLNRSYEKGKTALENAKDETLDENWTLRSGADIYNVSPKAEVIRMSLSQIIHHRAQLGVYLRLLDVPIPGSYGPSADEVSF
jgi:uncharacterized damage-inducible protein DinB